MPCPICSPKQKWRTAFRGRSEQDCSALCPVCCVLILQTFRWNVCNAVLAAHQRSRTASGFCVYCSTFPEERQMNASLKRNSAQKETAPVPEGTDAVRACSVSFYAQIFEHDFVSDKEKIRRHTVVWQGFLTLSPAKSAEKMCGKDAKQALKMINLPELMRWLFSWSLPEQERRCHAFSATIPTGWERSRWSCKYPLRCPPSWERRSSGWNPDP